MELGSVVEVTMQDGTVVTGMLSGMDLRQNSITLSDAEVSVPGDASPSGNAAADVSVDVVTLSGAHMQSLTCYKGPASASAVPPPTTERSAKCRPWWDPWVYAQVPDYYWNWRRRRAYGERVAWNKRSSERERQRHGGDDHSARSPPSQRCSPNTRQPVSQARPPARFWAIAIDEEAAAQMLNSSLLQSFQSQADTKQKYVGMIIVAPALVLQRELHCTLRFGSYGDETPYDAVEGRRCAVRVTVVLRTARLAAAAVEILDSTVANLCDNTHPHLTLALAHGVAPKESNRELHDYFRGELAPSEIVHAEQLDLVLQGVVQRYGDDYFIARSPLPSERQQRCSPVTRQPVSQARPPARFWAIAIDGEAAAQMLNSSLLQSFQFSVDTPSQAYAGALHAVPALVLQRELHCTLRFGSYGDETPYDAVEGRRCAVRVTVVLRTARLAAAAVEILDSTVAKLCDNTHPHLTLALAHGVAPKESNRELHDYFRGELAPSEIVHAEQLDLVLQGVVQRYGENYDHHGDRRARSYR